MVPAETNFQMATQLNRICVPVVRRKFPASSSVEKVSDSRKLPSLIRPSSDASIQADWRVDKNKAKAMLRSHFFLDPTNTMTHTLITSVQCQEKQ